jgi:D-erythrulose 1-phosphate 3-epimerase
MTLTLSINTNPLVNRFADPDDLMTTISRDIRVRDVQLTHEFINPAWPAETIRKITRQMQQAQAHTGVRVTSGMTGPSGRLNHFGAPDVDVRRYYVGWFKRFSDTIADLGGASVGTQFAILTYHDYDAPDRRKTLLQQTVDCWAEVADAAKSSGLQYLMWEPMSVGREFGETIDATLALQELIDAAGFSIPLKMMVDIDHGDVESANPDDYDPYAWARMAPRYSPIIHIKQSLMDKGGHRPFTAEFNARGRIEPERLIAALQDGGATDNEICLELSFREREPTDRQVVPHLAESVAFWAAHIDTGAADLR